jgi:Na+/phosphate symporter
MTTVKTESFVVNPFRVLSPNVDAEVLRLKDLHRRRVSESSTLQEGVLIMISKLIEMTRLVSECVFTGDKAQMDACASLGMQLDEEERTLTRYMVSSGLSGDMWKGVIRFPYRLERIGDMLENIVYCLRTKVALAIPLSDDSGMEMKQLFPLLLEMMEGLREGFTRPTRELLETITAQSHELKRLALDYRSAHWVRLEKGVCAPEAASFYGDILDSAAMAADYLEKMCVSLLSLDEQKVPSTGTSAESKAPEVQ